VRERGLGELTTEQLTSLAQSLKLERKPWAVMSTRLMRRSIISSAMFDSGLPSRCPAKT